MVGYIGEAVAEALRTWPALKNANVLPIRATDGTTVVVNTPSLPAVAIHVLGDDGEGNTFIGGGIRLYFMLCVYAMVPLTNYTFSPDGGKQSALLDLPEEIIRCLESPDSLVTLKQTFDCNLQFDRLDTDTTYATKDAMSITVSVQKIVYKGSVKFDPLVDGPALAVLKAVNVEPKNTDA